MTRGVLPILRLDWRAEFQEGEDFGDLALRLTRKFGQFFLREILLVAEPGKRVGEVEWVKIGTLPVLDDLPNEDVAIGWRLFPARHLRESGGLCGEKAPLPRDDPVHPKIGHVPDGDRLDNSVDANGLDKFTQGSLVDGLPGLLGIWLDTVDLDEERAGQSATSF